MTTTTETARVVAWRLRAPSVSGGKVYAFAIAGSSLVLAYGKQSATALRCRVLHFPTFDAAMVHALSVTTTKEREYALDVPPRTLDVTPDRLASLGASPTGWFTNESLTANLTYVLDHGQPV